MGMFGKKDKRSDQGQQATKPKKSSGSGGNDGLGAKVLSPYRSLEKFLRDVVLEMKRVVWPSKDETYTYTVVVVVAVVVVAAWVGTWDMIMTNIVRMLNLYH
jgi:preprotein translocase subunit SecE